MKDGCNSHLLEQQNKNTTPFDFRTQTDYVFENQTCLVFGWLLYFYNERRSRQNLSYEAKDIGQNKWKN